MRNSMRRSGGRPGVALDHAVLHLDGAAHGVDHAAKLDDAPVAGALDDAPVMHGDGGIDQIAAERPQPRQRPLLVGSRQAGCIRPRPPQESLRVSGSPPWQSLHHTPD